MWYFAWILGLGFALAFAILNAMWFEVLELESEVGKPSAAVDGKRE